MRWTVGVAMVAARHATGMSQTELADRLAAETGRTGDQATVARREHGRRSIDVGELQALRRIFGVSADWLLDGPSSANSAMRPQVNWGRRHRPADLERQVA